MNITIGHCNNIDEAKISLVPGCLNIKYGANGTGKSTIAQAISLGTTPGANLAALLPFKFRTEHAAKQSPSIEGVGGLKNVIVFNEGYINQFVFQRDEIVKNSFEIFIRNVDYEARMKEIEVLVTELRETFAKHQNIDQVLLDLSELSDSFGKSQSGFSQAGRIGKGLKGGNRLIHIPEKLTAFASFIKSNVNVKWIKWQIEGNQYLGLANTCPYCSSPTDDKKETILAVSKEYDANAIGHLVALQSLIERLGKYFSADSLANINKIVGTDSSLKKEEIAYLVNIKNQTDTLREKLADAKSLSFFALRDVAKVKERIGSLKIDLAMMPCMKSDETSAIVGKVNEGLDAVLAKAGKLEGEVQKQKKSIEKTITKYKDEIDQFLQFAGYKYSVDIEPEADSYKMKLRHADFDRFIESGASHLSYGEKNAFSLVLFMYECLTKKADLIILDDPISSFDRTKKFAILETLFRGKESFQDKTVLMLTHDIEPVIDLIKTLGHTFQPTPSACFITCYKGVVSEQVISKADVLSFAQICEENIKTIQEDLLKLIYLRRHHEIVNDKGVTYNLLSNLLHKRDVPTIAEGVAMRNMTPAEIALATAEIREKLPAFDYATLLARLKDKAAMKGIYAATSNRYEKLQLCRAICDESADNQVVRKYINESFHIENEYIMQLNPHRYDFVPEHIATECDSLVDG